MTAPKAQQTYIMVLVGDITNIKKCGIVSNYYYQKSVIENYSDSVLILMVYYLLTTLLGLDIC